MRIFGIDPDVTVTLASSGDHSAYAEKIKCLVEIYICEKKNEMQLGGWWSRALETRRSLQTLFYKDGSSLTNSL